MNTYWIACIFTINTESFSARSAYGIIFVDTENTFRAERVHQIAESRGMDTEDLMKKKFVWKIYYSAHLEAVVSISNNTRLDL